MKGTCTNCGTVFESRTGRRTCSTACAFARQKEAIRQMKAKSGEIYLRWHNYMLLGIARGKSRKTTRAK